LGQIQDSQPVPGSIGGGEPEGYLWGDDSAKTTFSSVADFDAWPEVRFVWRDNSRNLGSHPLVLCRMDLCRQYIVLEENNTICLLDWGCAGMYLRYFEIATLSWLNTYDRPYEQPLLQAANVLLGLTTDEEDSVALWQIVRVANLRYNL
jgi:thiamine kinase-like enzyme